MPVTPDPLTKAANEALAKMTPGTLPGTRGAPSIGDLLGLILLYQVRLDVKLDQLLDDRSYPPVSEDKNDQGGPR